MLLLYVVLSLSSSALFEVVGETVSVDFHLSAIGDVIVKL